MAVPCMGRDNIRALDECTHYINKSIKEGINNIERMRKDRIVFRSSINTLKIDMAKQHRREIIKSVLHGVAWLIAIITMVGIVVVIGCVL